MALGGGTFLTQNKTIPGAYINFATKNSGSTVFAERGTVAIGLPLCWGSMEAVEITAEDFYKNSVKYFGYEATAKEMMGIRDVFRNASKIYCARLNNTGQAKASCIYGSAKYYGTRGNSIKIVINIDMDNTAYKKVYVYFDNKLADTQRVKTATELIDNDFVVWNKTATLTATAGVSMTGGKDGTISGSNVQQFLNEMESYSFNVLTVVTDDDDVNDLVVEYTKRMRDEVGAKLQSVVFNSFSDYEGIVNINQVTEDDDTALMYWVAGALAGCEINESLTNRVYNGEYVISDIFNQTQLETRLKAGLFSFHRVGKEMRVLRDINSLVSTSVEKGVMFQNNQTVRICDQIANDVAAIFNSSYLGKVPNDTAGRNSLWSDIVKYNQRLAEIRAIDAFDEKDVSVQQGETKNSVVIYENICPVNSMEILYMKVTLE